MRITFIVPALRDLSGGAKVTDLYARRLRARGHAVTVIAPPPARRPLRARLRDYLRGTGQPRAGRASQYAPGAYDIRVSRGLPPTPAELPDADVIVATWWETAEWMMAMPPAKGKWAHFVQHYELFEFIPAERVDAVLAAPTAKITISRWLEGLLRDRFGNARVALVPNSVDTDQFFAPPRERHARPTVGTVYSVSKFKDFATASAAFELLRARMPDVRLVTFGLSADQPHLPLPAGTTHTVLPPQAGIRDIYAACDVWLCSSLSEGFGLPALEAMACRCPLVSTPVAGPADFLSEGVEGYFTPFGDAAAMADRLERVLTLPDAAWRAMSDAAEARARAYSWDEATDRFEAALAETVAAG